MSDAKCACVEESCYCTANAPADGEPLCNYCRIFEHQQGSGTTED